MKRILQLLFGSTGFVFYFVPVFAGIFNIGTIMGLAVFGGILLWGICRPKILAALPRVRAARPTKILTNMFCCLFCAGLFVSVLLSGFMLKAISAPPPENATVVVLGCQVNDGAPSRMLAARIKAAADYLSENPAANCVVSGGTDKNETVSEAECMYNELMKAGIAPERVYIEDKSTSTRENLLFSYEIIKENRLCSDIAVVTSEFHEYRARLIAQKLGIESGAVPASTVTLLLPVYWTRELAGIVYESIL